MPVMTTNIQVKHISFPVILFSLDALFSASRLNLTKSAAKGASIVPTAAAPCGDVLVSLAPCSMSLKISSTGRSGSVLKGFIDSAHSAPEARPETLDRLGADQQCQVSNIIAEWRVEGVEPNIVRAKPLVGKNILPSIPSIPSTLSIRRIKDE